MMFVNILEVKMINGTRLTVTWTFALHSEDMVVSFNYND